MPLDLSWSVFELVSFGRGNKTREANWKQRATTPVRRWACRCTRVKHREGSEGSAVKDERAKVHTRKNIPFSSSFFALPRLNCLHHEARSRFEGTSPGWDSGGGSQLRPGTLACAVGGMSGGYDEGSQPLRRRGVAVVLAMAGVVLRGCDQMAACS